MSYKKTVIRVVRLFNNTCGEKIGEQIGGEKITVLLGTSIPCFSKNLIKSTLENAFLYWYIYVFPEFSSILCIDALHLCTGKKANIDVPVFYLSLS